MILTITPSAASSVTTVPIMLVVILLRKTLSILNPFFFFSFIRRKLPPSQLLVRCAGSFYGQYLREARYFEYLHNRLADVDELQLALLQHNLLR